MKEDRIVCHHIQHGISISPSREYKPCCIYPKSLANNLQDYLESPELKQLRSDFDNGIRSKNCRECWNNEDAGLPSKRLIDLEFVFNNRKPVSKYHSIMVALGNSCNLACRTCGSHSSTTWIKEEEKLVESGKDIEIYPHNRFYQESNFMSELKDMSESVEHVYFMGGESLLAGINEHLDYLDYLIERSADQITLHYTTNATMMPSEKFWSRWQNFKQVDIQLSIDGTKDHFEYTRWPAKWSEVAENIKEYQIISKKYNNVNISIGHVISIFTVYYFPEFYKWCLQNKLENPYINLLHIPEHYNIQSLPKDIKQKVEEKLSKYHFNEIINYMNQQDLSEKFNLTRDYIKSLDEQRGQKFNETFPEFHQLLKDSK